MKKTLLLAIVAVMLISCGGRQQPTPRPNVWGDEEIHVTTELSSERVRVPFRRTASGLAEVQVSINGEPFNMLWDTGASITSISLLELAKLFKQSKISQSDYVDSVQMSFADGSIVTEYMFHISEIYIQGKDNQYLRLTDIVAVVSENVDAPLLIGQNVINNLPKHSFNESTQEIEFIK